MKEKTLLFLKSLFKEFYFKSGERVKAPRRIGEREFGYIPFGGSMIRHLSFQTKGELKAFLVKEAPCSVYYSNAYYYEPTFPMHEKGWKGADLAFDIDADDLSTSCRLEHDWWICKECGFQGKGVRPENCPSCRAARIMEFNWVCSGCLDAARREAMKLVDILMEDFGLRNGEISTFFSGNIGYHVVVENDLFEALDQAARGEIADYVACRGFMPEALGAYRQATYEDLLRRAPSPIEPGWRGRFARYFKDTGFEGATSEEDVKLKVSSLYGKLRYSRFKQALQKMAQEIGVAIDVTVTTDVHRIFRLPGTLHGETGLLKKECVDLLSFNPLVDAVVFDGEEIDVYVEYAPRFVLKERVFGPFKGERVKLPLMAAVYVMGKGLAEVV